MQNIHDNVPRAFYHYSLSGISTKQLLKDLYDRNEYFNSTYHTAVRNRIVQEERVKKEEWTRFLWGDTPTTMIPVEVEDDLTSWRDEVRYDSYGRPFLFTKNSIEETPDLVEALITRYRRLRNGEVPEQILLSALRFADMTMVKKRGCHTRESRLIPYTHESGTHMQYEVMVRGVGKEWLL